MKRLLLLLLALAAVASAQATYPRQSGTWRETKTTIEAPAGKNVTIGGTVLDAGGVSTPTLASRVSTVSAVNAAAPLITPTYDGSGQSTHADVLYFPGGWHGKKYWMAFTPYPAGDSTKENPSLLVSDDGTTWGVPSGLTNPVVAPPGGGSANSDPDIAVGPDNIMYMVYRVYSATTDTIYVTSSADGTTWSTPVVVLSGYLSDFLSPSILYWNGLWYLWSVDYHLQTTAVPTLDVRTATTPTGPWSAATTCVLSGFPSTRDLWHINVVAKGGALYGLWFTNQHGVQNTGNLYLGGSLDGTTWVTSTSPLLLAGAGGNFDDAQLYRGGAVPTQTGFDLWYGGVSGTTRRTGRTSIRQTFWDAWASLPAHASTHSPTGSDPLLPLSLPFGGTTNAYPMLLRNGTTLGVALGDGTGAGGLQAGTVTVAPSSGNAYLYLTAGGTTWRIVNNGSNWTLYDGSAYVFTVEKTTGAVLPKTYTFATLPTRPAAGGFIYCTDCATAATCAGSGSGHIAVSNGTAWTCQ